MKSLLTRCLPRIRCMAWAGVLWLAQPAVWSGRIVVANDEFPLADSGFNAPNDPARFALNLTTWFVDARPGRFLAISDDPGLTGRQLAATLRGAGHQWNVVAEPPATLDAFKQFDAVFLCAIPVPTQVLVDYVNAGGNVYVAGRGVPSDATLWNPFLRQFGLEFTGTTTAGPIDQAIHSPHPLFDQVGHLRQFVGSSIRDLDPGEPTNEIVVSDSGSGLFAVADSRTYFNYQTPVIRVSEVEISWRGETNTAYRIDYRSSLTGDIWVPVGQPDCLVGDGSILRYYDRVSIQEPRRFYRIVMTNCAAGNP